MSLATTKTTLLEVLIVIGLISLLGAMLLPAFSMRVLRERPSKCQNNLKQLGLVGRMYADECPGGKWPPVQLFYDPPQFAFAFSMSIPAVYPEYMTDPSILECPSDSDSLNGELSEPEFASSMSVPDYVGGNASKAAMSYTYWSHVFDDIEDEGPQEQLSDVLFRALSKPTGTAGPEQLVTALNVLTEAVMEAGDTSPLDSDIPMPAHMGTGGADVVFRLRDGVEEQLSTHDDREGIRSISQSDIWVMHDNLSTNPEQLSHIPGGCNVVYMDGHVAFMRFPANAPINRGIARILSDVHGGYSGEPR